MNDKTIRFCRAPSGVWVGWIEKDNAHYWGSGRTLDDLVKHVKYTLYAAKKCSIAGYYIASMPTPQEDVPVDVMSKMFRTRAWYGGRQSKEKAIESAINFQKANAIATTANEKKNFTFYETETVDGTLVVYGIIREEVARFNLAPTVDKPVDATDGTTDVPSTETDIEDEH